MLSFGIRPPFSFEVFLGKCGDLIPEKDIGILKDVSLGNDGIKNKKFAFLQSWNDFDTDLRNELVKIRVHHNYMEASKYLRQPRYVSVETVHALTAVTRNPSVLDSEKSLDQIRWDFLEELAQGHYFDLEFLAVYSLKLRILEKWERINTADKKGLLEKILNNIILTTV